MVGAFFIFSVSASNESPPPFFSAYIAAPIATDSRPYSGNIACFSSSFSVSQKRARSPLQKYSGPPRNSTVPSMRRPCARPAMVWFTTA